MANKTISVTIDAELYAAVAEHAKNKNVTISEVASAILATGISRLKTLAKYAAKQRKEKKPKAPKAAKAKAAPKAAAKAATKKPVPAKAPKVKTPVAAAPKPAAKPAASSANADRLKALKAARERTSSKLNGASAEAAAEA